MCAKWDYLNIVNLSFILEVKIMWNKKNSSNFYEAFSSYKEICKIVTPDFSFKKSVLYHSKKRDTSLKVQINKLDP